MDAVRIAVETERFTSGRTFIVNGAAYLFADLPLQRRAAWARLVRALHTDMKVVNVFGQFSRDGAAEGRIGFSPVEGDSKKSAAGAAMQAGIGMSHKARL